MAKTSAKPLDALDFLAHPAKHPPAPVCVLFGDESFLKRQVLGQLKEIVLSGDDAEFSVSTFDGRELELRDVLDALSTRALFGGGRHLVIIDEADDFVSDNRPALEDYVKQPKTASVLVIDAKQWPATTRLYKAVAETGLQIECRFPPPAKLLKWLVARCQKQHGAKLEPDAAERLAETVESDLGLFDQELAKLSALAGEGNSITAAMVDQAVGGWRAKSAWDMLDAALEGKTSAALVHLDHLLVSGEVPIALLAQIASNLRRLAAAAAIVSQTEAAGRTPSLRHALEQAGVKPFLLGKVEPQLRRLGRARAANLYRWLLEADLALKGASSSPARGRFVLEELIVRISAAPTPPKLAAAGTARAR
jgi:DNA polymerase III subunit delta